MKLYLSSYRVPTPEQLFELVGKRPGEITAAIIPNAKDYYAERARNIKLSSTRDYLAGLGIQSDIVDLHDCRDADTLYETLSTYTMIWVVGGNTFCLRDEMQKSGFDQIIGKLLEQGIVYAGESAGACVAGTSLRGLETADEPLFAQNVQWDGLRLIDSFILPHTDNSAFSDAIEYARNVQTGANIIELTDTQVLTVDGDSQKISEQ